MRRKPSAAAAPDAAVRFAWGAAFFLTLTLVAILGLAHSAQAVTLASSEAATAALISPDDEEIETEAEAAEESEFEVEECLTGEEEECEDESGLEAPEDCLLITAEATVFAFPNSDRVRLQVRYAAISPTAVGVDYGLHGGKGSLFLGGDRKRPASKGVLRLTRSLTAVQMAKVLAAKDFTVRLAVPAAPSYCRPYFERRLDVRRATPSGLSWLQSE